MQRLQSALPWLSLLGGVVNEGAWGTHSLRGALFMGDSTFDEGAVGALMAGPLEVQPHYHVWFVSASAAILSRLCELGMPHSAGHGWTSCFYR